MQAFKDFLGKGQYFVIGALATAIALAFSSGARAVDDGAVPRNALSPITIMFIIIGLVVSILYLKAMLTVLDEAAGSYHETEEETTGSYYAAPAWGALLAGIAAAFVIWSYGVSPSLLYLGPVFAMISPMAIVYCMAQDIKNFKAAHAQTQEHPAKPLTSIRS
ncbi:hypothetical protein [cf. Phormidesmis sp. LEGE 11477]|uniref:hypothetical protein n=1 Tax=cf. Phormidesmis sp. LEGE 11477 TaxID=1828680 RepID=UPI00187F481B|nr:hypothetical protein [cf. Phormidesmis sp. LEGE 11477]MBE9061392.1 hypothetical protein [cf. Phormidesmis sp. LEGE 11477]